MLFGQWSFNKKILLKFTDLYIFTEKCILAHWQLSQKLCSSPHPRRVSKQTKLLEKFNFIIRIGIKRPIVPFGAKYYSNEIRQNLQQWNQLRKIPVQHLTRKSMGWLEVGRAFSYVWKWQLKVEFLIFFLSFLLCRILHI